MCKKGEAMPEKLVDDDDNGDTIMSSETEIGVDVTRINADPQPITETLSSPFKKPKVTKPAFDFPPAYLGGADNQAVLAAHPSSSNNPLVFLDINLGDDFVGRIVIELFANVVPRTAENFRQLCIGVEKEGKNIGYKGTIFHRVINRFMLQGGDFENSDGSGGESIYGKQFEDENFLLKHEVAGQVSMANSGPNTNGSQFFISTVSCPHLDDKHVVFGIVKKGLGILTDIEVLPGDSQDKPLVPVTIVNSGEIKPDQDQGICENDGTPDVYPHHPEDLELDWYLQSNFSTILNILKDIKESGNIFYRKGDHVAATRKYKKCYKYITMLRDTVGSTDDEEEIKVREVEVPCVLNIAAVNLRFHEYDSAIYECNKVLEVKEELEYSPDWVCKARFRRGQAQAGKRNFSAAVDDLNVVLKLKPEDTGVRRRLAELKKEMEKYKQIEKNMYGKMFGKNV